MRTYQEQECRPASDQGDCNTLQSCLDCLEELRGKGYTWGLVAWPPMRFGALREQVLLATE